MNTERRRLNATTGADQKGHCEKRYSNSSNKGTSRFDENRDINDFRNVQTTMNAIIRQPIKRQINTSNKVMETPIRIATYMLNQSNDT